MPLDIYGHVMYTYLMKNNVIGDRPPLPETTKNQIRDIMAFLNDDAVIPFTGHNTLIACVDWVWCKLFPDKTSNVQRKRHEKMPF